MHLDHVTSKRAACYMICERKQHVLIYYLSFSILHCHCVLLLRFGFQFTNQIILFIEHF